jgi:putative ABC transport system ATP-binding protein
MIHLDQVRKAFNRGRANEFWALDGIDLTIRAGTVTVLRGPSGSGKTTLLTMAGCLARPTEGRVRIGGRDVSALPERFLAEVRRATVGLVFQNFNLLRGLTALANVMVPAYPTGCSLASLEAKASALLAMLNMADKAHLPSQFLSGGEAQRVAIARALVNDPKVVIADEPTANLDSGHASQFLDVVMRLKNDGKTVLIASHDPLVCDAAFVDDVVSMRDGRLLGGG